MSVSLFLALQRLAEQHAPELGAWAGSVLQRWRDGEAFERAADLKGPGAISAAKRELLAAADLLDPDRELGIWRLAGKISQAFRDFERRRWPAARRLTSPDTLPVIERCFWRALSNSDAVPRSQDRIADALAQHRRLRQCAGVDVFLRRYRSTENRK